VRSSGDIVFGTDALAEQRADMAAIFRWSARLGMHESVANHFSLAIEPSASRFLVNPQGRYFGNMRASDLLIVDADDPDTMDRPDAPDPTAWAIHAAIHRNVPDAHCVLHLHPHYATALASLADSRLPPVDQNAMRFFNRHAVDEGFDGMGLGDEAERLSRLIGGLPILVMGNHGVLATGDTPAIAFGNLYYFELACRNYLTALASGLRLRIASDEVAEKTARQWDDFIEPLAADFLREIREVLDREEPDYKS